MPTNPQSTHLKPALRNGLLVGSPLRRRRWWNHADRGARPVRCIPPANGLFEEAESLCDGRRQHCSAKQPHDPDPHSAVKPGFRDRRQALAHAPTTLKKEQEGKDVHGGIATNPWSTNPVKFRTRVDISLAGIVACALYVALGLARILVVLTREGIRGRIAAASGGG
jgi:hypothetical protein